MIDSIENNNSFRRKSKEYLENYFRKYSTVKWSSNRQRSSENFREALKILGYL